MAPIPTKDAKVSVEKLFPDFLPNKVLRFSKLFGPGKYSSLPHTWKKAKRRRQRREEERVREENEAAVEEESVQEESDMEVASEETSESEPSCSNSKPRGRKRKVDDEDRRHCGWGPQCDELLSDSSLCVPDEEEIYCRQSEVNRSEGGQDSDLKSVNEKLEQSEKKLWRHGPGAIWFDMLGVPEDAEDFDYGCRLKPKPKDRDSEGSEDSDTEIESRSTTPKKPFFPDDCFNMISQLEWERNIIWDGQDSDVKALVASKSAGWVPSSSTRSVHSLVKTDSSGPSASKGSYESPSASSRKGLIEGGGQVDDTWYSIFPVDTPELVNGAWENDIIWDVDGMDKLPKPKVLELDPNDENIILCTPEDVDPNARSRIKCPPVKVKIPHPHLKKSKILLGKAGVINVIEEDSPPPSPKKDDKDPYNISLDEYYQAKSTEQILSKIATAGHTLQHSTPVIELRSTLVPTHLGPTRIRQFHRTPLRKYLNGPLSIPGPHPLARLNYHIMKKAKEREEEHQGSGGGDIFFLRTIEDLSAKDGAIILVEYSEEYPPMLGQPGMCSLIKNYFKRFPGQDAGPKPLPLGEIVYSHTSPFLGALYPGQMLQALENNMYRAPIYAHTVNSNEFLVIRDRYGYYIRLIDFVYTAGQECPLYEVSGPNSKRANNFTRDFLQVFIYRQFWQSNETPRRIRMDDIKKAFPDNTEGSIRKKLKLCSDFHRTGNDSNWWVIRSDFRLPSEEELRALVSPEECCAHFSLITAEQRLKDAGYGAQSIAGLGAEAEEDDNEKKLEDEVKTAPWNTTRAYCQAVKGKCILQIDGPADPTGCGEGFSYVRMPNKPQATVEQKESNPRMVVTGTDADLRRLSLSNAKALLRKFDVPEEEIKQLSRWEVIDVVRTLSTEKAKVGDAGMTKFSRGSRFSTAEHQERYKEECQRLFELQNRVLYSNEVLSTDEGESSDDEANNEEFEEMGKNIEHILTSQKTTAQLNDEREEAERLELQKMIMEEDQKDKAGKSSDAGKKDQEQIDAENSHLAGLTTHPNRILKILRIFKDGDGNEFTRTEIVRRSNIIDIYVRIRTTKDEQFIEKFTFRDEPHQNAKKREKRRMQEQLRRLKRIEGQDGPTKRRQTVKKPKKPPKLKKNKINLKPDLKVKCGACGSVGHMKTNKACPLFDKEDVEEVQPSRNVAMTIEEEAERNRELSLNGTDGLIRVDGTKLQISRKLMQHACETQRRALVLKVPRDLLIASRRKRAFPTETHCDYLEGKPRGSNRRRIDPNVVISNIFESILNELKKAPDSLQFSAPVSTKTPGYYDLILNPMDLRTMREKNRHHGYLSRADFLGDMQLMVDNSRLFNGDNSVFTISAKEVYKIASVQVEKNDVKLSELEKQINPPPLEKNE